jgi:uncharacterized protein (TIGR00251 family)
MNVNALPDLNVLNHSNSIRDSKEKNTVFLDVDISPNSAQAGLMGYNPWRDRLLIKLRSHARRGRANSELVILISDILHIESNNVNIVKGEHSTQKTIKLNGLDRMQVVERIFEAFNE